MDNLHPKCLSVRDVHFLGSVCYRQRVDPSQEHGHVVPLVAQPHNAHPAHGCQPHRTNFSLPQAPEGIHQTFSCGCGLCYLPLLVTFILDLIILGDRYSIAFIYMNKVPTTFKRRMDLPISYSLYLSYTYISYCLSQINYVIFVQQKYAKIKKMSNKRQGLNLLVITMVVTEAYLLPECVVFH